MPGVVAKPPGFKGNSEFNRIPAGATILSDRRLNAAVRQESNGLLDVSYSAFLELLCDFPDSASKMVLLEFLATNREATGDLEAAIWFIEKAMALVGPSARQNLVDRLVRVAEWYAILGDQEKATENIDLVEATLSEMRGDSVSQVAAVSLVRMARLYARGGDVPKVGRTLERLSSVFQQLGAKEGPRVSLVLDQLKRMATAAVARAYVQSGQFDAARTLSQQILDENPRFAVFQVPSPKGQWLKDALLEGPKALALESLA
jgi:hypothetical protein